MMFQPKRVDGFSCLMTLTVEQLNFRDIPRLLFAATQMLTFRSKAYCYRPSINLESYCDNFGQKCLTGLFHRS